MYSMCQYSITIKMYYSITKAKYTEIHMVSYHVLKRNTFFVLFAILPYACITFKK